MKDLHGNLESICDTYISEIHIYNREITYTQLQQGSGNTVYPKKYAHGFVVLCFVVVMQSFIMNPHEVFIHIH